MKKSIIMLSLVLISVLLFAPACSDETTAPPDNSDIYEPNGTFDSAASVLSIGLINAYLDPAFDKDFFIVEATSSVDLKFVSSSDLELLVHIYNKYYYMQIFREFAGSKGAPLSITVPSNSYQGSFYIKVESADPYDVGSYTIKLD